MRDAAGELPHGLHLLRLEQRRFGVPAFRDLHPEAFVGLHQLPRPLRDARFERFRVAARFLFPPLQRRRHLVVAAR